MNTQVLFSSKDEVWATPQDFFDKLNEEFHFTLDPCCTPENAKCAKYFTPEDDGLQQNWGGEIVFCNPPYCRKTCDWVKKAYYESKKPNTRVVMLLAARTDTKWFHEYIYNKAELRFIKGRIKFGDNKRNAPFRFYGRNILTNMKKPRKVKKLQRKLLQLFIERQRLQNRILNLYDRVTVMLAKGEISYDEAIGFEKSCFGINVGLIKVNRKIDNVLNCKRLNKYYKMLKKEDDHYERNCY